MTTTVTKEWTGIMNMPLFLVLTVTFHCVRWSRIHRAAHVMHRMSGNLFFIVGARERKSTDNAVIVRNVVVLVVQGEEPQNPSGGMVLRSMRDDWWILNEPRPINFGWYWRWNICCPIGIYCLSSISIAACIFLQHFAWIEPQLHCVFMNDFPKLLNEPAIILNAKRCSHIKCKTCYAVPRGWLRVSANQYPYSSIFV